MKKLMTLLLAIALTSCLASCGAQQKAEQAGAPETSPSTNQSTDQKSATSVKTFSVTADKTIDTMNKVFASLDGCPNAFATDPKITEEAATENVPAHLTYTYIVCKGVYLYLNATADTKELMGITLTNKQDELTKETAKISGAYAATLIDIFESDDAVMAKIDEKLDLVNSAFVDGTSNYAIGTLASFSYTNMSGWGMLSIDPL